MNKNYIFMVFFIYGLSLRARDCKDIDSLAGKLNVYSNGQITIDGQQVEMKAGKSDREIATVATQLKVGEIGPSVTGIYTYSVTKRNSTRFPIEINVSNEGTAHSYSGFSSPTMKLYQQINIEQAKDGSCYLKRTILNSVVTYDRELCEKLSKLFDAFSKTEIEKCNQIVSKMASTVDDFKKSVKSKGLNLSDTFGKNSYQEAIAQSARCAQSLNDETKYTNAISVPKDRKKPKTVQ